MNKFKGLIAVLIAFSIVCTFAACSGEKKPDGTVVTQAVTDENGETVTDENGQVVTEVVTKEENDNTSDGASNGSSGNSGGGNNSAGSNSEKTSKGETKPTDKDETATKKDTIKKPDAPKNISSLKAKSTTKSTVTLQWSGVKCDGYEITWYLNGERVGKDTTTKTTYTAEKLVSLTKYEFSVCAYNKNSAGTTRSTAQSVFAQTKADEKISRKIKITVKLPTDGAKEDTLTISVNGKEVKTAKVKLDGSEYTFTTKDKYKGEVVVTAQLKNTANSLREVHTDKEEVVLSMSDVFIEIVDGEDDE